MKEYRLSDVVQIISGGTPKTEVSEYWNGSIPWLSVKDFAGDRKHVYETEKYITELGVQNSATKVLKKNDIVISARGTVGEIVQIDIPMAFNQSCYGLRAKSEINPDFLYYVLKVQLELLKKVSNGAVFDTIVLKTFDHIKVQLPPLPTQQKIASILSAYDNLIQNYKKQIEALQTAASEIYKEWFVRFRFPGYQTTKFENGLPEGWKLERIGEYFSIKIGGDVPEDNSETKNEKHKYPVFSNGINDDGLYGFTDTFKISEPSVTISARGTVGFVCLRREPYYPIVRLICLIPKKEIGVFYLFHSLKYADLDGNGTSQQQLTAPMVSKRKIIIADENLIKRFNTNAELFYDKIDLLKSKIQNLTQQRDLLLPRLMRGALKVH